MAFIGIPGAGLVWWNFRENFDNRWKLGGIILQWFQTDLKLITIWNFVLKLVSMLFSCRCNRILDKTLFIELLNYGIK